MANIYNSQLDAFTLYHKVQESRDPSSPLIDPNGKILPALGHGLAGSAGAAISNVAIYPLELIITRLQVQRQLRKDQSVASDDEYQGLQDAVHRIYHGEGGLEGFYTGVVPDTAKTIADSFLFFLMYTFLRQRRMAARGNSHHLPALDELGVGFVAGSLTKLVTTPIANVVTRKQANALVISRDSTTKTSTSSAIARDIYTTQGLAGFWSGYSASLILTLNPSLTFFLFETFKLLLLPKSRRPNPPAWATFLMAAISKSCANSVTYPFSLAKARAQSGAKRQPSEEEKPSTTNPPKTRTTILSTLLAIAHSEGISGLYTGLPLELLKGFLSHGTTMLVKQTLHTAILQLYSILNLLYTRYRKQASANPFKLAERAKQRSFEYFDLAVARANERVEDAKKAILKQANETAELVAEYVDEGDDSSGEWRNLYGTTGLAKWLTEK